MGQSGRSGLMSTAFWQCLLTMCTCLSTMQPLHASTNNKYLENSPANRRDLQWSAAPGLHLDLRFCWSGSSTIWCSFWLTSAPILSESNQRKQKRKLLDCCIPVWLRTSAVDWAFKVRDQARTRHRQWLCNEKAIAVLAGGRSEILEGCCKLIPNR